MGEKQSKYEYTQMYKTIKQLNLFKIYNSKVKSVLLIVPHPDDEIIGCGGSLLWHLDHKQQVTCCYLTDGSKGNVDIKINEEETASIRKEEVRSLHERLTDTRTIFWDVEDMTLQVTPNLVEKMINLLLEIKPDLIYAPSPFERHPDHRNAFIILKEALNELVNNGENIDGHVNLYSVWDENFNNSYLDITKYSEKKMELLDIYNSQSIFQIKKLTKLKDELVAVRNQLPKMSSCEGFYRISVSQLNMVHQMVKELTDNEKCM